MTVRVFVDFGDNFPNGGLTTTVGAIRDVAPAQLDNANNPIPNSVIPGPQLTNSLRNNYPDSTAVTFTQFSFSPGQRAQMIANAQDAFSSLDVSVIELTSTPLQLGGGVTVAAAANMAGIVSTLRALPSKDVYVLVARPAIGATNDNPNTFATNGYGGISPTGTVLGDVTDLSSASNNHDDLVLNFRNDANTIVHEAGHALGLQHAVTTAAPPSSAVDNTIETSEVMSYLSTKSESDIFFSRYPMVRGDSNTDPNNSTNPPTPPPLNNNDLEARDGQKTPFDQLRADPNVGENPNLHYISGTGANDIINITGTGNTATVSVKAFDDAAYTTPITVPGTSSTVYTYVVNLDRTLLVQSGLGNDSIYIRGNFNNHLINIEAGSGNDTIYVGNGDISGLPSVSVGGTGRYNIIINDGSSHVAHDYTVTSVAVTRDAPNWALTYNSSAANLTLITGATTTLPYPTVTVTSTLAATPVTLQGSGNCIVNIGTGNVQPIRSSVTVTNTGGFSLVTVDDHADTQSARTVILYNNGAANGISTVVDGFPTGGDIFLRGSSLRSLTLRAGNLGNIFRIHDTPTSATPGGLRTTVSTGAGNDTVTIDGTTGPLYVEGAGGSDTVNIGTGDLHNIRSSVTVTNTGGFSAVSVDDHSDKESARTVLLYNNGAANGISTVIDGFPTGADIVLRGSELSSLSMRAGDLGNTFRIHDTPTSATPGGLRTTVSTGAGNDTVTIDGTTGPLWVEGTGGADTVYIGTGDLHNIRSSVTVTNTGGFSAVSVDDHADKDSPRTVLLYNNGAANGISTVIDGFPTGGDIVLRGSELSSLSIRAGKLGNIFRIHDTPTSATPGGLMTTIQTGLGKDMVTVDGTTGALDLNTEAGNDDVFVGNASVGLNRIQGAVSISGGGGKDTLTFNDQSTTTRENYTLSADQLSRIEATGSVADMAPITFAGFQAITLNVSSGGSATSVVGSAAGSTVTVNGNPGSEDQFAVDASLNALLGPVIFHGQSADADFGQYFDLGNAAPHTYTLTAGSVGREDQAPVLFDGLFAMIVYAPMVGGSTVNVNSEAAGAAYEIVAANGDHVTIGSLAPNLGGTLANILDQVKVVSTANDAVSLVVDDSGNADTTAPKHITFDKDSEGNINMIGLAQSGISWLLPSASSVTVRGGAANEIFSMNSVVAATPLTIVGGTGSNTLDYSAYTTDVSVNLQTGTATDLAGITDSGTGRVTIQNVIGGSGNDTLIAGADRSILIGGGGADQLVGGSGEDLLIAGTTDYTQPSLNAAAFDAILQEWTRTDLGFDDRMSDLLTGSNALGVPANNVIGGTPILLNSMTVHDDLARDVLTGGTGRDWYFIDASDVISNEKPGDAVTMV
jgi:hypothetical protein